MQRVTLLIIFGVLFGGFAPLRAEESSIGIAIIFDTSGSMNGMVKAAEGKMEPKYQIGKRALEKVIHQLNDYQKSSGKKLIVGLYVFKGKGGDAAVPMSDFNPEKLLDWMGKFSTPTGATPLGNTMASAVGDLLYAKVDARHVLVVTDGENTVGPSPEVSIKDLYYVIEKTGKPVEYHFIAFDVSASVFAPVKKLGATLVSASNETQLQDKLTFILEEKILLEQE